MSWAIGLTVKWLIHITKCGYLSGSVCRANSGSSRWSALCRSVHVHRKDRFLALGLFRMPCAQRFLWLEQENSQTTTPPPRSTNKNKQAIQVLYALTSLTWCASCGGRQLGQDVPQQQITLGFRRLKRDPRKGIILKYRTISQQVIDVVKTNESARTQENRITKGRATQNRVKQRFF